MNFVEVGPVNPLSFVILLVALALIGGGVAITHWGERTWTLVLAIAMLVGGLFGFGIGMASLSGVPLSDQRREVIDQIEEAYGLELSSAEFNGLGYPEEKPESDFEVFGSAPLDERTEDGFERTEVFLIWRDGEMALAGSPDGETFTELKR